MQNFDITGLPSRVASVLVEHLLVKDDPLRKLNVISVMRQVSKEIHEWVDRGMVKGTRIEKNQRVVILDHHSFDTITSLAVDPLLDLSVHGPGLESIEIDCREDRPAFPIGDGHMKGIEEIRARYCPLLKHLALAGLHNLRSISISGSKQGLFVDINNSSLHSLEVSGPDSSLLCLDSVTELSSVDVSGFGGAQMYCCGDLRYIGPGPDLSSTFTKSKIKGLYLYKLPKLGKMSLTSYFQLTYLYIDACETLQQLELPGMTCLASLKVTECPSLRSVDVSGCVSLRKLTLKECDALVVLDISGCTHEIPKIVATLASTLHTLMVIS